MLCRLEKTSPRWPLGRHTHSVSTVLPVWAGSGPWLSQLLSELLLPEMMSRKAGGPGPGPGGMASIEGLPPLPKSLSGLLNSSGGSWRDMERLYVKKTMIQDELSRGRSSTDGLLAKPASLDAALALLRKEMVGLRQQDMSLLCQLWSLHESIQEYKGSCQDLSAASSMMENSFFDEDDEFYPDTGTTPTGEHPDGELGDTTPNMASSKNSKEDSWDSFHVTI